MEHKVTQADLAALARAGDLVILFDGWNELPPADRKTVRDAISHFHQDYEHASHILFYFGWIFIDFVA